MHSFCASLPGMSRPAEPAADAVAPTVCAVVVTYRPGAEVPAHVAGIRRQAARVIVVDNEASPASRALLGPLAADPAIELIHNAENLGIATGLNQGVARALAAGFPWIATFDQDSVVPEAFFRRLLAALAAFPDHGRVALVAPIYRDRHLGFLYSSGGHLKEQPTDTVPIPLTAASGNVVSAAAFRAVGGFRDDFFIDCVDFEFCLRCRRAGWLILEARSVVMDHAMGRYEQRRLLWRRPRVNDYPAVRRYYQARNRLILYSRFATVDPRWILRDAYHHTNDALKLLLYGENRREKVRAMLTGVWHACTGRRGRWDQR